MQNNYATIESQLGNEICNVEDTEEIFWLKMSDDFQSRVKAGDLLVGQYRFKDAVCEYQNACRIKQDDYMIYLKLGGAYLTLFDFEQAEKHYNLALKYGANIGDVAFYLGIKEFLHGNYFGAVKNFETANADNGEMLITVIYWHTIAAFRAGTEPLFLEKYQENIDTGHHGAYKTAVSVFCGHIAYHSIDIPKSSLDSAIILYGIGEYLKYKNEYDEAHLYFEQVLKHTDVWPCISYLAAYNTLKTES